MKLTSWTSRYLTTFGASALEILEIYSSVRFLRGLIEKLMENELMQTEDEDLYLEILLSAGPDGVWEAWEASDYNVLAQYLGFGDAKPVASPSKMSFANPTKSSVAKAVIANTPAMVLREKPQKAHPTATDFSFIPVRTIFLSGSAQLTLSLASEFF
ncbi:hypothetical protein B0H14DRAFT_3693052 [Mycena olivaceomarginata]|nr:hypothetical protein B0H14DRAFT_3693052 [Mycena olivaceomarginata]